MALVQQIGSDQVRLKIRYSGGLESGGRAELCQDQSSQRQNYVCVGRIFLPRFPLKVSLSPGVCVSDITNVAANQIFQRFDRKLFPFRIPRAEGQWLLANLPV